MQTLGKILADRISDLALYSECIKSSEESAIGKQAIQHQLGKGWEPRGLSRLQEPRGRGVERPQHLCSRWDPASGHRAAHPGRRDPGFPASGSGMSPLPSPDDLSACFQPSSVGFLVNSQISSYDELPLCFLNTFPLVGSLFIPHLLVGPVF